MADHRHRVRWFCDGFTSVLRWLHIGSAMASHRFCDGFTPTGRATQFSLLFSPPDSLRGIYTLLESITLLSRIPERRRFRIRRWESPLLPCARRRPDRLDS
jgi:hypothetical protein